MYDNWLIFDEETSLATCYTWGGGMHEQEIVEEISPSYIMCFAYQWFGGKTKIVKISDFKRNGKREVVKKLRDLLDKADVVIGHNSKKFDVKNFNTWCLQYHLKPPSPFKQIDTLQEARKYLRLPSYKLDYIAKRYGHGGKLGHAGKETWKKCMRGEPSGWREIAPYCINDVNLDAKVLKDLLPFIQQKPVVWDKPVCKNCGEPALVKRGFEVLTDGKYQRYKCANCGKITKGAKVIKYEVNA